MMYLKVTNYCGSQKKISMCKIIRANKSIVGISIFEHVFKLSAYADDTTFFINDLNSVKELFFTFNKLLSYSGLKLNASKAEICGIGAKRGDTVDLFGAKCINLENDTIKILGIHLFYDKNFLDDKNFFTIITKIESSLSLWRPDS